MTLQELLEWKSANQDALTEFLHQNRELSGIHFMPDEGQGAYIQFSLKSDDDTTDLEESIRVAFGQIPFQFDVVDPDRKFERK